VLGNADYTRAPRRCRDGGGRERRVQGEELDRLRRRRVRQGIKVIKVKKDAASEGIAPSDVTVKNGTYPLSRPLFFYLRTKPAGEIKAIVDWVLSAEGQAVVLKVGYFPVK